MMDEGFKNAGFALSIEDNPDQKIQSKGKSYAPVAFGPKVFTPAHLKILIYFLSLLTFCGKHQSRQFS